MESGGNHRLELGKLGEDIACELLREMGHSILERNFRNGHLEIDIISYDASGIHFVEVKTRKSGIQAPPQDNVNIRKQKHIVRAAKFFLRSRRALIQKNMEYFFDVVAVTFEGENHRAEWFPQAYIPLHI